MGGERKRGRENAREGERERKREGERDRLRERERGGGGKSASYVEIGIYEDMINKHELFIQM